VSRLKASLRDINQLKTIAIVVTRNLREAEDITSEISGLERDLDSTGTTRTIQDVQREIKDIMEKM
jgi:DNA repair protein RAD50